MIEHEIEYFLDKKTIDYPDSIEFMEKKLKIFIKIIVKNFYGFMNMIIFTLLERAQSKKIL